MKRLILIAAMLAVPFVVFAQAQTLQSRQTQFLKRQLGLNDSQVTQVLDIQKATVNQMRKDSVHLRLLRAEIAEAMLPQTVDQTKVNDLVDQMAQTRADSQKALIDARIQLRTIMGNEAFQTYQTLLRARFRARFRSRGAWGGPQFRRFGAMPFFGQTLRAQTQRGFQNRGQLGSGPGNYSGNPPGWAPFGPGGGR